MDQQWFPPARPSERIARRYLARPLVHLQASLQADIARRAANAFERGALDFTCRGEFRPLAPEFLTRPLLVVHAGLHGLIYGKSGGGGNVELAIACNIVRRNTVSHPNPHQPAQDNNQE